MDEYENLTAETTEDEDISVGNTDVDDDIEDDEDVGSADADNDEVAIEEATEDDRDEELPKPKKEPKGEKSSEYAQARRQKEKEDIRTNAIIEAVGVNPYTNERIEDGADVEEYLLMKRIADNGGDPIGDYAKELKTMLKTRNQTMLEYAKAQSERERYIETHPEDEAMLNTAQFNKFAESLKGVGLTQIIGAYKNVIGDVKATAKTEAEKTIAQATAKRKASPGSVTGTSDTAEANNGYYTAEQLRKMSPNEIERNWAKVEKSYERLNRKK